jgi:hypothetical protein
MNLKLEPGIWWRAIAVWISTFSFGFFIERSSFSVRMALICLFAISSMTFMIRIIKRPDRDKAFAIGVLGMFASFFVAVMIARFL